MRFCNTIQPSWRGAWAASKCLTALQSQAREAVTQQETGTEHPQGPEQDKSEKKGKQENSTRGSAVHFSLHIAAVS